MPATKLTPELVNKICGHIRSGGLSRRGILLALGIEKLYYSWLAAGRVAACGSHHDLLHAILRAEAHLVIERQPNLLAAADMTNAKYVMAFLRDHSPELWRGLDLPHLIDHRRCDHVPLPRGKTPEDLHQIAAALVDLAQGISV